MSGQEFGDIPQAPRSPSPEQGGVQRPETPAWTDEDKVKFRSKLVEIGIINEGGHQSRSHDLPEDALSEHALVGFLGSHVATSYLDSLKDLSPEERRWRMHKLYTGVFSEETRRNYEATLSSVSDEQIRLFKAAHEDLAHKKGIEPEQLSDDQIRVTIARDMVACREIKEAVETMLKNPQSEEFREGLKETLNGLPKFANPGEPPSSSSTPLPPPK